MDAEYVLSLSYGKDSMACIHVVKDVLKLPLTRIIHAEVWATDTIPADLPPMVEFKAKADKIIKERWGIEVEHICALKKEGSCYGVFGRPCERGINSHAQICYTQNSEKENMSAQSKDFQKTSEVGANGSNSMVPQKLTYENIFYREIKKSRSKIVQVERERDGTGLQDGQRIGQGIAPSNSKARLYGFPIRQGSWCTSKLKQTPLNERPDKAHNINVVQYIGIAADEPKRIERHKDKPNVILPLVEAGWTEAMCRKWCEENDLLSPTYTTSMRGGCWFCHNQGVEQLRQLRHNYPDLWAILLRWDNDSPVTFHADGHTVHDFDKRFQLEDDGLISKTDRFKWDYLDGNIELKIDFNEERKCQN